jgi:hypothetical protein
MLAGCLDNVDPQLITTLYAWTACYGDRFPFLYVDDIRTSQEAHLGVPTAWYGDNFTFLYVNYAQTS